MTQNSPQYEKTYWPMIEAHFVPGGWQATWQIRVGAAPNSRVVASNTETGNWHTYVQALDAGLSAVDRWLQLNGTEEP